MGLGAVALVRIGPAGRGDWRPALPTAANLARGVAIGVAFGLGLVAITAAGSAIAGTAGLTGAGRPAAPFVPWAAITILVASAEEVLLRGRLFDAVRRAGGVLPALAITTAAFALMHVPLYGWHVVPLDLVVGLVLGELRRASGTPAAPAVTHVGADLAAWFLR
jgi:membrane protease YdiL (CAAX protease family)